MADKVPVKGGYDGSSLTGLAEFVSGDTLGIAHGGTGLATIGTNQLVTGNGTSAMTSESDLTFDGTTLATTAFTATGNVSLDGGTFIFNESGADKDFRIEGDTEANLFISDASTDRIGIGTATPSHLLDVEGVAHVATCITTPKICISSEYALPAADGSAGQLICTDGSGALAFADAASSGHTIAEEGSVLASRTCLNFVGAAVTAADNSGTNATDVTVCATNALLKVREADGTQCCITLTSAAIGGCLQGDTSPTLGGNLDVNGNSIVSASNGNIPITPNGSGIAIIDGICHPTADGSAGQVLCTNGSAALQWATVSAGADPDSTNTWTADQTFNDNVKLSLGTGGDADIYYDASHLIINAAVAGTGWLKVDTSTQIMTEFTSTTVNPFITITGGAETVNDGGGIAFTTDAGSLVGNTGTHAYMQGIVTQANPSALKGDLRFFTNGGDSLVERLRIADNGHVGIGTAAPVAPLEVEGTAASPTSADGAAGIAYFPGDTSDSGVAIGSYNASPWNNWIQSQQENGTVSALILQPRGGMIGVGTATPPWDFTFRGTIASLASDGTDGVMMYHTGSVATFAATYSGGGAYAPITFNTCDTERMRIGTAGGTVGIGTTVAKGKLHVLVGTVTDASACGTVACTLVLESCENNPGIDIISADGAYGQIIMRSPATSGGGFNANVRMAGGYNGCGQRFDISVGCSANMATFCRGPSVHFAGSVSKGSGSFRIEHPLESKKDTHRLVHSFIEGPQADLIYRGVTQLVDGSAEINIDTESGMTDGTFIEINRCVQVFTTNETNWDLIKGSVTGNILTIESKTTTSTATISWMVIGERKDKHMFDTEWTDEEGRVIVEPEIEPDATPPPGA